MTNATENNAIPSSDAAQYRLVAPRGSTKRNAIFRSGAYVASILVGIFTVPYVVRHLGVEAYGIVGIVNVATSFMSIVTVSLTSTVGRNLTFAVEQGDYEKANKEISTAMFGLLCLIVLASLPLTGISLIIDRLINVPPELVAGTRVLFLLALLSFGLMEMSGPMGAAMFVRNRLDLFSGVSLLRSIFIFAAIVALFSLFGASLVAYGIAVVVSSILVFGLHWSINRHLLPGIVISLRWFDRSILRGILSLGGWMTLNQVGALLYLQTDLLVANRVVGVTAAGQLAAVAVVSMQLRSLGSLISGLFAPNQAAIAARGDIAAFSAYLVRTLRLMLLLMALLVGVFCGSARLILSIWLGKAFAPLFLIAILLTSHLVVNIGVMPFWGALLALGKVKWPAVITLIMGAVNVTLGVLLAGTGHMGLMGIALAGCITLTLKNSLFTPWYVARCCGFNWWIYMRELGIGVIAGAVISMISYGISAVIRPQSLITLAISLMISACLGGLLLLPLVPGSLRAWRRTEAA